MNNNLNERNVERDFCVWLFGYMEATELLTYTDDHGFDPIIKKRLYRTLGKDEKQEKEFLEGI